jgi:hypothetical protein
MGSRTRPKRGKTCTLASTKARNGPPRMGRVGPRVTRSRPRSGTRSPTTQRFLSLRRGDVFVRYGMPRWIPLCADLGRSSRQLPEVAQRRGLRSTSGRSGGSVHGVAATQCSPIQRAGSQIGSKRSPSLRRSSLSQGVDAPASRWNAACINPLGEYLTGSLWCSVSRQPASRSSARIAAPLAGSGARPAPSLSFFDFSNSGQPTRSK